MSALRAGSRRYPPKWETLEAAKTEKKINPKTGRMAQHYRCTECQQEHTSKEVEVDHIIPVVPLSGWVSWDNVIERMFCTAEGLQILCLACHLEKTKKERQTAKMYKMSENKTP